MGSAGNYADIGTTKACPAWSDVITKRVCCGTRLTDGGLARGVFVAWTVSIRGTGRKKIDDGGISCVEGRERSKKEEDNGKDFEGHCWIN